MKILVTGANGFVGKNLIQGFKNRGYKDISEVTRETDRLSLEKYTKECDFVFHLAGVNRPKRKSEFIEGNVKFTSELLELLKNHNNKAPILLTSSIQAEEDNIYGQSKKVSEELVFKHGKETCTEVFVYRLTNLFGKWSRPNYNSVVSTFCHNIARDMDIQISNPETKLRLSYIDDAVDEFINAMEGSPTKQGKFFKVPITYNITLGKMVELIKSFKNSRESLFIPDMEEPFVKKLYSTYLSYLPTDGFSYPLKMNMDSRGSFTEFLKFSTGGQVSINISRPGVTKGNHWHNTKNEKFVVVSGEGIIEFRKIDSDEIIEYKVSGEKLEVVDIPPGYTHNIINVGNSELVTVMWANEIFSSEDPDTYFLEV